MDRKSKIGKHKKWIGKVKLDKKWKGLKRK